MLKILWDLIRLEQNPRTISTQLYPTKPQKGFGPLAETCTICLFRGLKFQSVQSHSCVWIFEASWTAEHQASLSRTNSQSLLKLMSKTQWWHPTISSSVVPCSFCLQSFPASVSLPMSQFFISGGQSIGVSASASVLPMNNQDWFPLGWTGWISLQSKGLSRVFSNTTAQKHQFFSAQLSSQSNSHIYAWLLKKP